jgi:hypothetical protein
LTRIRLGKIHEEAGDSTMQVLSSMTTMPPEPIMAPTF